MPFGKKNNTRGKQLTQQLLARGCGETGADPFTNQRSFCDDTNLPAAGKVQITDIGTSFTNQIQNAYGNALPPASGSLIAALNATARTKGWGGDGYPIDSGAEGTQSIIQLECGKTLFCKNNIDLVDTCCPPQSAPLTVKLSTLATKKSVTSGPCKVSSDSGKKTVTCGSPGANNYIKLQLSDLN